MFAELARERIRLLPRAKVARCTIADPDTGKPRRQRDRRRFPRHRTARVSAKNGGSRQVADVLSSRRRAWQGCFYETMNIGGACGKLAVISVWREQPLRREYTPCGETIAGRSWARARGLRHPREERRRQARAKRQRDDAPFVERARRGEGPAFSSCQDLSLYGHHVGDVNREYRTARGRGASG